MITSMILYLFSFLLSLLSSMTDFLAQGWSVWPASVLNGLTYFFSLLMDWDFLINTSQLLTATKWLMDFEIIYLSTKLLLKLFNWIRGTGSIELN
jgi:hypothetical protein